MRSIGLLILLILSWAPAVAQPYSISDVRVYGGATDEYVTHLTCSTGLDSELIGGYFFDAIELDSVVEPAFRENERELYIGAFSGGEIAWIDVLAPKVESNSLYLMDLKAVESDGIYAVVSAEDGMIVQEDTSHVGGSHLLQYASDGRLVEMTPIGGSTATVWSGSIAEINGDLIVFGYYHGEFVFGSETLTSPNRPDGGGNMFISRYSESGAPLSIVELKGQGGSGTTEITLDHSSETMTFAGWSEGDIQMGDLTLEAPSSRLAAYVLGRTDFELNPIWLAAVGEIPGNGFTYVVGPDGAVYFLVSLIGDVTFNGELIIDNPDEPVNRLFVGKLSSDGDLEWIEKASEDFFYANDLMLNDRGEIVIITTLSGDHDFGPQSFDFEPFTLAMVRYSTEGLFLDADVLGYRSFLPRDAPTFSCIDGESLQINANMATQFNYRNLVVRGNGGFDPMIVTLPFPLDTSISSPPVRNDGRSVNVYPSPAHTEIRVSADEPIRGIAVFDILGRQRIASTTEPTGMSTRIDVSSLPAGLFLVRVEFIDGSFTTSSFLKQ